MIIKNMSKRERYIALAAVSFVFAAVIYNFVIDRIVRQWQSLNDRMGLRTSALKKDIALLASRKTLEANYAKFSKYIRSGNSEEESAAETLAYLENLSRSDLCLILNIKPIGSRDLVSYKEMLIDLSCEGSIGQLTKFLYDIENTKDAILKVRHFVLTSKAGQDGALKGSFLISKIIIR